MSSLFYEDQDYYSDSIKIPENFLYSLVYQEVSTIDVVFHFMKLLSADTCQKSKVSFYFCKISFMVIFFSNYIISNLVLFWHGQYFQLYFFSHVCKPVSFLAIVLVLLKEWRHKCWWNMESHDER
jgi:hypothetical protein